MYQIKLSVDSPSGFWIDYILDKISNEIRNLGGIHAVSKNANRISVCFAVPEQNKSVLKKILCDIISKTIVECQKSEYFNRFLNIGFCDLVSKQMLVNTLTYFNSYAEKKYVLKILRLTSDFNLDGFYNFKLRELVAQWAESVEMITQNAEVVRDEESFNIMLKFLLSGIDARIKVVYILQDGKHIRLRPSYDRTDESLTEAQLLVKLTEIAPEKVIACNRITNDKLVKKIGEIFCLKEKNYEKI